MRLVVCFHGMVLSATLRLADFSPVALRLNIRFPFHGFVGNNSLRSFTGRSDGFLEGLGLARKSPGRSGRRSGGGDAVKTRAGTASSVR